jgi:hypothetical protein
MRFLGDAAVGFAVFDSGNPSVRKSTGDSGLAMLTLIACASDGWLQSLYKCQQRTTTYCPPLHVQRFEKTRVPISHSMLR